MAKKDTAKDGPAAGSDAPKDSPPATTLNDPGAAADAPSAANPETLQTPPATENPETPKEPEVKVGEGGDVVAGDPKRLERVSLDVLRNRAMKFKAAAVAALGEDGRMVEVEWGRETAQPVVALTIIARTRPIEDLVGIVNGVAEKSGLRLAKPAETHGRKELLIFDVFEA